MNPYRIVPITKLDELEQVRAFWQAKQWHPGTDFDYYCSILSNRNNIPCVLAAYFGDDLISLLIGRLEVTLITAKLGYASVVGATVRQLLFMEGGNIGQQDPEVATALLADVPRIMAAGSLDLVTFEHTRIGSPQHHRLLSVFGERRLYASQDPAQHWLLRLPSNMDSFLSCRSKKHRYWLKRLRATLDRDFKDRWEIRRFASEEAAPAFVEAAEKVAAKTYHRALNVGFRADCETLERILREGRRGQLRGYVLFIDSEPASFWYSFTNGITLYLVATGYNPAYRTYELGTVLLMSLIEEHCGSSVKWLDFGLGDASYKRRFASEDYKETSFMLFAPTIRARKALVISRIAFHLNRLSRRLVQRYPAFQAFKSAWRRRLQCSTAQSNGLIATTRET